MVKIFSSSSPENLHKILENKDGIWFIKIKNIDANIAYLTYKSDEILKCLRGIQIILKQNQLQDHQEREEGDEIDDLSSER